MTRGLCLPQEEPAASRGARTAKLAATQARWSWNLSDRTLPPRLNRVPLSELPFGGVVELLRTLGRLLRVMAIGHVRSLFASRQSQPFQALAAPFGEALPPLALRWKEDEEFAMQRLNGLWPDLITRCTVLPAELHLTDALVDGLLPEGATLESLLREGHLYLVDQRILAGCPTIGQRVTAAPLSLFFVDTARQRLLPLAVKLTPEADAPVFTPKDPPGLWLAVKAFVNNADLLVHVAVKHFLRMHFAMEVFYGAMVRHLSERHPIHAFLRPHFFLMLFANKNVRQSILSETDWWIIRKAWPEWSFAELHVPRDFQRRGVDDPSRLPHFHFRDESLLLWGAFEEYVRSIVQCVYPSDGDVEGDVELQTWMGELRDPELGNLRGLPLEADGQMRSREQLVELLTGVLFNVTSRHNHNTNAGRQYYAYTPNTPISLTLPLPTTRDDIPEATLSEAMPPVSRAVKVIADIESVQNLPGTFNVLARYPRTFLAEYPDAREHVQRFQDRLIELEQAMKQRDRARAIPYPYLYPSLTANSVWS